MKELKAAFSRALDPLGLALSRLGISPSAVTLSGLGLVIGSCAFLLITRRILVFCVLVTIAALLDVVDGAVARAANRRTRFGSYLDAMCDRYTEGIVAVTVAVVTGYWFLSFVALFGALLISYAKARAAMEVSISNQEWPDLMERAERDVIYIAGLIASQLVSWRPMGHDLFWWTLVILAILVHVTAIQRITRARRLIHARASQGTG